MSNVVYFHVRETNLDIASQYKYLGLVLNEFLDLGITANILSDSAGRALGALIAKTQNLTDLGFETYLKLFNPGVLLVLNYGAEIWGFQDFACCTGIQNRAARYYLGSPQIYSHTCFKRWTWLAQCVYR